MKELKLKIAQEALIQLAGHYKTTTKEVSIEITNGNTKLFKELNDLCEKSMELILKEI